MGKVTIVGIDLAKNVFSLHVIDETGAVLFGKPVSRAGLMSLIAQWPACLIGIEVCSGAHEWARRFQALGHEVRIMAARFVAPYRRSGKNDGNDAVAANRRRPQCPTGRSNALLDCIGGTVRGHG